MIYKKEYISNLKRNKNLWLPYIRARILYSAITLNLCSFLILFYCLPNVTIISNLIFVFILPMIFLYDWIVLSYMLVSLSNVFNFLSFFFMLLNITNMVLYYLEHFLIWFFSPHMIFIGFMYVFACSYGSLIFIVVYYPIMWIHYNLSVP